MHDGQTLPDLCMADARSAADQLQATLVQTEAATETILEACEALDRIARGLSASPGLPAGDVALELGRATRTIYAACGFQDITGQRIVKAADTVRAIEARVIAIAAGHATHPATAAERRRDDAVWLLEGPQTPAAALAQDEIDRLLASFE